METYHDLPIYLISNIAMICYVFCFPIGDAYMAIHDPWGHGAILFHNVWPHYMGFDPCPSQQEWIKNSKNLKDSDSANQVSDLWSEFQDLQQFLFFAQTTFAPKNSNHFWHSDPLYGVERITCKDWVRASDGILDRLAGCEGSGLAAHWCHIILS